MAIADKRPDDVLKWYDKMVGTQKPSTKGWGSSPAYLHSSYGDQVAAAVATSHPDRALEIYQRGLDSRLPQADYAAYESCAACLKKMQPIYQAQGRGDQWQKLIADIRQKYGNRPRFMEILDKVEGRTILQSQKAFRR